MQDQDQQAADQAVRWVTVFETKGPDGQRVTTGRFLQLSDDCPLFAAWGETGKKGLELGSCAIDTVLFEEIIGIITAVELQRQAGGSIGTA